MTCDFSYAAPQTPCQGGRAAYLSGVRAPRAGNPAAGRNSEVPRWRARQRGVYGRSPRPAPPQQRPRGGRAPRKRAPGVGTASGAACVTAVREISRVVPKPARTACGFHAPPWGHAPVGARGWGLYNAPGAGARAEKPRARLRSRRALPPHHFPIYERAHARSWRRRRAVRRLAGGRGRRGSGRLRPRASRGTPRRQRAWSFVGVADTLCPRGAAAAAAAFQGARRGSGLSCRLPERPARRDVAPAEPCARRHGDTARGSLGCKPRTRAGSSRARAPRRCRGR